MGKILRKRFDLDTIASTGMVAKEDFNLDKHTARVKGILVTSDRDDMMYHRGTIQVLINGEEIIPDNYHAKLLMSGLGVSPKDRYLPLDLDPGNGIVKVTYTDTDNIVLPHASYTVSIYVELETDEDD